MSLQHVALESGVSGHAVRGDKLWNAESAASTNVQPSSQPSSQPSTQMLNARVVEFIAKPGKFQELEDCVQGKILEFLNRQYGFSGAMILSAPQERRQILVVSFWATQQVAAENCWESSRVVRQTASSFIDVCSRARTFEAALANSIELKQRSAEPQMMWPEARE